MLRIIQNRKYYFFISGVLVLASLISIGMFGLKLGIDFTGGSLMEITFLENQPANNIVTEKLLPFELGEINLQPAGEKDLILRLKEVDEDTHQKILQTLEDEFKGVEEQRFESVGPVIGQELKSRSFYGIIMVLIAIISYIAFAFRKVSRPVASWKFGVAAIIALFHDVIIPVGVFSLLGHYKGVEVGLLFVTALLTVLGFSVHDSIVVFDRIRETLRREGGAHFEGVANKSVNITIARSLNTSFTTLLVLVTIFLFGGETIKYFALTLIIGIVAGTYSSIFIASTVLAWWEGRRKK
ncbi:MAG: protein translocase subunit SecF [Candidatus Portnoybacteria bacterium CG10_big_fil_rev_8_21_14_0_10_36_7]|uniref:Protein-export membrane protein SecF n=1 Tax=Candidatus Portnoybacteria bacterium CG10_big_fil_rev_8_21_14_0_10_36_7 TaxID=1974812 RepID=A0A2M8KEG9_9BACT|nr:MAG: protein translocase subunit SecF [Candidatus Portnoybacteria bacterium CG10_big_fil_rev_8_21_14_0_10_36_7]